MPSTPFWLACSLDEPFTPDRFPVSISPTFHGYRPSPAD